MAHNNDSNLTDHNISSGNFSEFALSTIQCTGMKLIVKATRVDATTGWDDTAAFSVCTFH